MNFSRHARIMRNAYARETILDAICMREQL